MHLWCTFIPTKKESKKKKKKGKRGEKNGFIDTRAASMTTGYQTTGTFVVTKGLKGSAI